MAESSSQRRVVHYSGHVQGVGFRFMARNVAQRYAVTGYVRNLADGRVQLLAEGAAAELDRFLEEIQQRMAGYVTGRQVESLGATGEYSEFEIQH